MICSKCGKIIVRGTKYVLGDRGGKYHVKCAQKKYYQKKKPYRYVKKSRIAKNEFG